MRPAAKQFQTDSLRLSVGGVSALVWGSVLGRDGLKLVYIYFISSSDWEKLFARMSLKRIYEKHVMGDPKIQKLYNTKMQR